MWMDSQKIATALTMLSGLKVPSMLKNLESLHVLTKMENASLSPCDMSMMSMESEITEFADQGLFTKLVSYDVDGFSEDCYRTDHVKWLESAFHVEEP
mmetsp:Transcript_16957/g.34798  ORF Transcript_16957/g.34798 Transcript_16957/m.34798 type:complete len:98 (-) Transcript_16957:151-444(-)